MLDSVGGRKSPYEIVVKVVHPPGAGGLLSLLSVWRGLLPFFAFVKMLVMSRHSERNEESPRRCGKVKSSEINPAYHFSP